MSTPESLIADAAVQLSTALPRRMVASIAEAIRAGNFADWQAERQRILQGVAQSIYRRRASDFLDLWHSQAEHLSPQVVAMALTAAGQSEATRKSEQSVELVWTGPHVEVVPLRRTEQALLQVIQSAKQRLLIVSYAVYNIPHIRQGLLAAADRGVEITLVLESPDRLEGQNAYDTLRAVGEAVVDRCSVFIWPLEHRERDANGKAGILHVKAAVADGSMLFLSSANLTEYAFTVNMELGLLMTGGRLPHDVEMHFDRLVENRILVKVGAE